MTHHTTELRERPHLTAIGKAARNECFVTPSGLAVPELQQVNALDPSPLTEAAGAANRLNLSVADCPPCRPTAAGASSSLSLPPFPSHWTAADCQWFVDNLPENG